MYKIDLHTHSIASRDGGLDAHDYEQALNSGRLDMIAITDHNTISFAKQLNKKLGDKIIVGEEIDTASGEIIGLFLSKPVKAKLTLKQAVAEIKSQNGLVYIPHPFEKLRQGLQLPALTEIAKDVDIIEIYNGRAVIRGESGKAIEWAKKHYVARAASSDAHGRFGWGNTYTKLKSPPTKANLLKQLKAPDFSRKSVGFVGLAYPARNKILNLITGSKHA